MSLETPTPMAETLDVPQGQFSLARWPDRQGPPMRAWDAADEYVLHHIHDQGLDLDGTVVIVNDGFGALATALGPEANWSWGDSTISHRAMAANIQRSGRSGPLALSGQDPPPRQVDLVLLKFPKHNGLLEDQLHRLRPSLHSETVIVSAGMVRNVHTSTLALLESVLGPTTTSLARKKARLAFTVFDPALDPGSNPWPLLWEHRGLTVVNHGGVFSARSIDIGTRFLLENLPEDLPDGAAMVDLGCGNGVVGASLLQANPSCTCLFVDESYAAITSARHTIDRTVCQSQAQFSLADDLGEVARPGSIDLIVTNPPFHASTALSVETADAMFRASHRALRGGGELRVIGNRHLGHHVRLRKIFSNCAIVASNRKFVVMRSVRR